MKNELIKMAVSAMLSAPMFYMLVQGLRSLEVEGFPLVLALVLVTTLHDAGRIILRRN